MNRPITTLFMLESVDGKISTGNNDSMDFDKDLPKIKGVKEGLKQYYQLEKETDFWSLNTGRVMEKIGVNKKRNPKRNEILSFVIIDNKPHLNLQGLDYLANSLKNLVLVTSNKKHPAFKSKIPNLVIIYYKNKIDFQDLFQILYKFGCKRLTIQSGGTLNSTLLRNNLIDNVSLVIAPCLIGGKDTPTLIDGDSLNALKELNKIKSLKLQKAKILKNSYLKLLYKVTK